MRLRKPLLFLHIRKTGGTSLRRMLTQLVRSPRLVYPNEDDLRRLPNCWYPGPAQFVGQIQSGALRDCDVLIGHFPAIIEQYLPWPDCLTAAFLRDPVERTFSVLDDRVRLRLGERSLQALLDDEAFVEAHVRNYQTKIFAFDDVAECAATVDCPLAIDAARFSRARQRLLELDVIGLTERFEESARLLSDRLGRTFRRTLHANAGALHHLRGHGPTRNRIIDLVRLDLELYDLGRRRFEAEIEQLQPPARPVTSERTMPADPPAPAVRPRSAPPGNRWNVSEPDRLAAEPGAVDSGGSGVGASFPAGPSRPWSPSAPQDRMLAVAPAVAGSAVSVVVPSWNCGWYLAACLDSLLAQTRAAEIIVVNDGSTDETREVLARYAGRVRAIHHDRQRGANAARNTGLRAASGDWIVFADADAVFQPDWLARLLAAAWGDPRVAFVYSGFTMQFDDGQRRPFASRDWSPEALWWDNYINMASLVRRDALPAGGLNEASDALDDWELWLELASRGWTGRRVAGELFTLLVREAGRTRSFQRAVASTAAVIARFRRRYARLAGIEEPLAVVIPASGSDDLTSRCLEHLALYCGVPFRVVYVDNGSPAGTVEAVRETAARHCLELRVLQNATNEGFTPAVNRGLRAAGRRHCLVLNNDCFVGPHCVERLWWTLATEDRCAVAGPLTCDHGAQSIVVPARLRKVGARPEIREHWHDPVAAAALLDQRHRVRAVPMVAFFCALLHRDAIGEIGLLDERFATGLAADDEWCDRALRADWRCLVVQSAWATHLQSETFRRLGLDYSRLHKEAWAILRQGHV